MRLLLIFLLLYSPTASAQRVSQQELLSVQSDRERQIRNLREQEIKQLRIALGRRLPTRRRADLYFRLAEIYIEAYRMEFILEGKVLEKRVARGKRNQRITRRFSKPLLRKGLRACQQILDLNIRYGRMDQVFYFMAFNYGELGNRDKSREYFRKVISRYPASEVAIEAYRELGEEAFRRGNFQEAKKLLVKGLKSNPKQLSAPVAARIYHKLAWSHYRTRAYSQAIATMKKAIKQASATDERFLSVKEEALRDMAVFMTEQGRASEAIEYFKRVAGDGDYYARALERLGREYERKVQTKRATRVYETLLRTNPSGELAFRVRSKLFRLDLRRARFNSALARLKVQPIPRGGEPETLEAVGRVRSLVRTTAVQKHEQSRRKSQGKKGALRVAELFYEAYIELFLAISDPKKERAEILMYLGEVKTELRKDDAAAQVYRQVVETSHKKYAREASELWLASLGKGIAKRSKRRRSRNASPSKVEKEYVRAADDLQNFRKDSALAKKSALKAAKILAGYGESQEDSLNRLRAIIRKWPQSKTAGEAARLWVQILEDDVPHPVKGDRSIYMRTSRELKSVIAELLGNKELMRRDARKNKGKLRRELTAKDYQLQVGRISVHERNKDFDEAADAYLGLAKGGRSRGTEFVEQAYSNSVHAFLKADKYDQAKAVISQWRSKYPRSKKANEASRDVATILLIEGEFRRSAQLFEKIGQDTRDSAALETAARLYEGHGDFKPAIRLREQYLKVYPRSSKRWGVALALGKTRLRAGLKEMAKGAYVYCSRGPRELSTECRGRLADLHEATGKKDEARRLFEQVARIRARAGKYPYIGYSRYRLAEILEGSKEFAPLKLPEARLQVALAQRLQFFEKLTMKYGRAVDSGGPWAVAALHRLAKWTLDFADELDRIKPPRNVSTQKFRKTLASVSKPLRKKARETWSRAYRIASRGKILSPVLPAVVDHLSDLKVRSPRRAQGSRGKFRVSGVQPDGGSVGHGQAIKFVRERLLRNSRRPDAWVDYGNLLWGDKKPLLAKLAYERALSLKKGNVAALNNWGVVLASEDGQEDWYNIAGAVTYFTRALNKKSKFVPSLMNLGAVYNYYRLFRAGEKYWRKVLKLKRLPDVLDGLAISLQGLGRKTKSDRYFRQADALEAPKDRFVRLYHGAANAATQGRKGMSKCIDLLDDIDSDKIRGFEAKAVSNLKRTCERWKNQG